MSLEKNLEKIREVLVRNREKLENLVYELESKEMLRPIVRRMLWYVVSNLLRREGLGEYIGNLIVNEEKGKYTIEMEIPHFRGPIVLTNRYRILEISTSKKHL